MKKTGCKTPVKGYKTLGDIPIRKSPTNFRLGIEAQIYVTHVFLYPSLCENHTLSEEEDEENQQQRKFKCDICDIAFRFQVFFEFFFSSKL